MIQTGKVWLAGAGPGDAGLLTVRAKELLEESDVIVYDALVSLEVFGQIPPKKELIYVGVATLENICNGLIAAGMDRKIPAAVIEQGTNSTQKKIVSSLESIASEAKSKQIQAPAVIVVGHVCGLEKRFSWMEKRPLSGLLFLVTRPAEQQIMLVRRLRNMGAQVIEMPTIRIHPIAEVTKFEAALRNQIADKHEKWMVFTSSNGVRIFFEKLAESCLDIRDILSGRVKIAAIGDSTEKKLLEYGWRADFIPEEYCAETLGKELAKKITKGCSVRIFCARQGSKELLLPLHKQGVFVEDVPLYDTEYQIYGDERIQIKESFEKGRIDAVTFTSASTVRGFVRTMRDLDFTMCKAVCIGRQTAKEAAKYGMQIQIAKQSTMDSMIELIEDSYGGRQNLEND